VRYSLRHFVGTEIAGLTIHVDGLRYQPNAVERAEAIQRTETIERPEAVAELPRIPTAAAGATASRKRKPR
jgi:hypothetical protein